MIACFGDSITEGRPGVTYLRYLDGAEKYYNMGLSGDTLLGLSKRVDQFRNNSVCVFVNRKLYHISIENWAS